MSYKTSKLFIFFILYIHNTYGEDEGILCTGETCSTYISENSCSELPDNCKIQNSTYNGLFLPSPDPCNCCNFCLENLNEGDYCALGEIGGVIPSSICGPGLMCSDKTVEPICVKINEIDIDNYESIYPCSYIQGQYDKRRAAGTVGFMEERPECDDNGYFQPYKCVPGQSCFCLDKYGNRIFGEIPYTSTAHLILNCECPRKYYEVLKFFDEDSLHPNQFFRCTETGDYDTIQCIDNECMCTDAYDGAPTIISKAGVNITDISETTLEDCFDKDRHETGQYYYSCAEQYLKILKQVEDYENDGYDTVFNVEYPSCDLNGKYAAVQKGTRNINADTSEIYYYCADSDGNPIENYEGTDKAVMNCNCARTLLLLSENFSEKPECCDNGSFNRVQCRRGRCYCVDSDGSQDVNNNSTKQIETDIDQMENLFCYAERCKN